MSITTDHPQTTTCATWCTYQDPTDEACLSEEHRVTLSLHPRERYTDGSWRDDYVTAYAVRSRAERDEHVSLDHGEDWGMRLTPAEARRFAAELVKVAALLDGGASS